MFTIAHESEQKCTLRLRAGWPHQWLARRLWCSLLLLFFY